MWNEREKTEITNLIKHLSEVTKITKDVTLEVNFDDEEVLMLNHDGRILRHIDISGDSAYGVLKDVMKYVIR
ncbi:hypothetical protein [uncultured Succinivibrio sp.]|uniref:hypothetical protein n=1 Tax=uncultured Succinivibrio sp. TaxID=540749 RepID=UPI0025D6938B|nr:hypothetical protein [uncultured Succinivibrio sp.]